MAKVTLDAVTKIYPGGVEAVRSVSLDIEDREFVVLVGPSGCGKSTTLRMVAGLEEITKGTIRIGDRVVNDVPPKDRDIAMVFQNYALYPHMTVYKNMAFGLKLRGYPKSEIRERVQEAARILNIEELLERKPKALSGGQRQRVALGRAIVRKPAAFLFDEPLSNLDAKLRVGMRAELKKLHNRLQTTSIYVTHDQVEAMTLGNKIVVMNDGVVQQVDAPLKVYEYPTNQFVAGFIGAPPMNFMNGNLYEENGDIIFGEGTANLKLYGGFKDSISDLVGKDVVFGVRPENLFVMQGEASKSYEAAAFLDVEVKVMEPLGSEMILYLGTEKHDFIGRVDSHVVVDVGDTLKVGINMKKVHIFDGETGENKTLSASRDLD